VHIAVSEASDFGELRRWYRAVQNAITSNYHLICKQTALLNKIY